MNSDRYSALTAAARAHAKLALIAALLAFGVVVLGAYVRLSDAGLGCPDWPGCYGHLDVPQHPHEVSAAEARFGQVVEAPKAWKEMIHRYFAGTLGLLILAIAVHAWLKRRDIGRPPWLATALLVLVVFQALLGMWTVTLLLKPVIVSAHLLGGMATLALLVWLALRTRPATTPGAATGLGRGAGLEGRAAARAHSLRGFALFGVAALFVQIALGGWVSSNYAALACTDFPTCQGQWVPPMDFESAFHLTRELGKTADGEALSLPALTAIHWLHRLGALLVLVYLGLLGLATRRLPTTRGPGTVLLVVLVVQVTLGVLNVVLSLPLPVAVAHNGGAALLLATLVVLNFRLAHQRL